jgi:hypothetical protein
MCSANCTAASDSSSPLSSSKTYSSSTTVLTNDSLETLGVWLFKVEDDCRGEIGKRLGAGGEGVRGIGDGVRVGTCTSSDVCVDKGGLLLLRNVQYACNRREMIVTSLTKLGWTVVQGYDRRTTLTER